MSENAERGPDRLVWQRYRRGGGEHGSSPTQGPQLYSLMPIKNDKGRYTGRHVLSDHHFRTGRVQEVASKDEGRALAEDWLGQGPATDGFARMRSAWGSWHEQVEEGKVGVAVILPLTGDPVTALVSHEVYEAAKADDELRIPVEELELGAFSPGVVTKQVP